MIDSANKKEQKSFIMPTLKVFLFSYLFLSVARFFIGSDSILSKQPIVLWGALFLAVLSIVTSWFKSLLNLDLKKRKYRYVLCPLSSAMTTYLFISILRYAILEDTLFTKNLEVILFSIMIGIFKSIEAKIDDISPRNPKKEPKKPFKYYIDKFIIHAGSFHKVMFFVYGSCFLILILILIVSLMN